MPEPYVVAAGSPRSGTTLLRTLLRGSSHLVVHKLEPQYILDLDRRFGRTIADVQTATEFLIGHKKFPNGQIDPVQLREAVKGRTTLSLSELLGITYRLLRGTKPDATVVLKHPAFILHMDLIAELFPELRVIQIIRDPRATAFSQRTRWRSTSLWMSATSWQAYVDAGEALRTRGRPPYMDVRYEDLVREPELYAKKICDFIGIRFEAAMLTQDHVQKDWNPTNPGEGSRRHYQGFEKERIDKWRRFMTSPEIKLIENQCRRGMLQFGYEPINIQVSPSEYLPVYLKERRKALEKTYSRMKRRWRERAVST